MPRREDDAVDRGPTAPAFRVLLQAGGFLLAVGATLAVLFTDNVQLLKVAVVAVAWAFVLATFAAGRRGVDRVRAAAREGDLRRAYELELEREVAARREYELGLENDLRRETQDAVQDQLDALRGDIAALADLRDEVARMSGMRGDIAALGGLRDELARVADLRDDVAALAAMRSELGQLAALREEMGRLRAELAEQLSSEMLVERIVMRTQASRLPGEATRLDGPARVLDGAAPWSEEESPRELTGGWPAIRLDDPRGGHQFEQVRTSTWSTAPATTAFPAAPPPSPGPPAAAPRPPVPPRPSASGAVPPAFSRHDRAAAHEDDAHLGSAPSWQAPEGRPPAPPRTVASPLLPPSVAPPPAELPAAADPSARVGAGGGQRRRRTDDLLHPPVAEEFAPTTQHPAVTPSWAAAQPADETGAPGVSTSDRLAQILAENGVTPSPGGRRRRRYREDGESDDVLARVLGR